MPVTSYLYDSTAADRAIDLEIGHIQNLHDKQLLWIDVTAGDEHEIGRLKGLLNLTPESIHFLLQRGARPRLADYGHYTQLNINAIQQVDTGIQLIEVGFIIRPNLIVTVHRQPVVFLENFEESLKSDTDLGILEAESFLAGLLDWHITSYFRMVESIERQIDKLDANALLTIQDQDLLADMAALRQNIAFVRRVLTPHREVYTGLLRREFQDQEGNEQDMTFPILNERLETAIESVENARELLIGSFDMFTTRTTMKTNEVMKALTLVSFVWFPASVVVAIAAMLMKTPVSPINNIGFWVMLGCIVFIAIVTGVFARLRKWI